MEDKRIRAFVDASVLFAACYSPSGASREILRYALRGQVIAVISELVLKETERNLTRKRPQALSLFQQFRSVILFEDVEPTVEQILQMQSHTVLKDAPVIAAAKVADVDYLVSLDRRHMIEKRDDIETHTGVKILLPSEFLVILRQQFLD